jgi:hypothetical protein
MSPSVRVGREVCVSICTCVGEYDNKGRRKPRSGNDRGRKEEREVEEGQGLKNEAEEVQKGEEGERTNDHDPFGRSMSVSIDVRSGGW